MTVVIAAVAVADAANTASPTWTLLPK
jgi:hypothetical protein